MESELERLRKKVENFPSASAYNRLAELVRSGGDDAGAEQACRRCIKEFPRNGQAYVILAEIELSAGRKAEAVKHLLSATERDSRSYTAHNLLAEHYISERQIEQALTHLRHILTFKANDPAILQRIEQLRPAGAESATARPTVAPRAPTPAPGGGSAPPRAAQPATASHSASRLTGLAALCAESGVRGALVADARGRVVTSAGLAPEIEDVLAGLAAEITGAAVRALEAAGTPRLGVWSLTAAQGQIFAFRREGDYTVVALTESGVRPAMLELRARQALHDLGAA